MLRAVSIVTFLLALAIRHSAAVPSFVNGSFETPLSSFTVFSTPGGFSGWTMDFGSSALLQTGVNLHAAAGQQFLFLPGNADGDSQIEQALTGLVPNVDYEISYSLCEYNASAAARSCSLEIVLHGDKVDTLDPTVPASTSTIGTVANPWQRRSFQFTAEGTTATLSIENFRSDAANGADLAFDDFAIRALPKGQPIVAFLGRKPEKPIRKSSAHLHGTCTSLLPIASITVATKHRIVTLSGSSTWTAKVPLAKGANRFVIIATDIAGTNSAPVTRKIRRS